MRLKRFRDAEFLAALGDLPIGIGERFASFIRDLAPDFVLIPIIDRADLLLEVGEQFVFLGGGFGRRQQRAQGGEIDQRPLADLGRSQLLCDRQSMQRCPAQTTEPLRFSDRDGERIARGAAARGT